MSIRAEVDRRDVARLNKLLKDLETYTGKKADDMIKQTMRFAVQSAANATRPRKGGDKSGNRRGGKLAKKHLFRPLVPLPSSMGFWYVKKEGSRPRPFKSQRELSRGEVRKKGLKKVTKAIKKRESGKWVYIPYAGTRRNESDSRFRIPYAGLAKDAWYRSLEGLGDKKNKRLKRNRKARGVHKLKIKFMEALAVNRVSYISKSSPAAARYGLNRAKNRMVKIYQPKVDKAIERRFKRR